MNKRLITLLLLGAVNLSIINCQLSIVLAQCPVENTAFKSGERLEYKLYFNWKFIWKTAGSATLTTQSITYKGKAAYQSDLITRTQKIVDKWFCMRDTLRAIYTTDIVPLRYRKGANEGGKYRLNEIDYSYPNGKVHVHAKYRHGDGRVTEGSGESIECVYDMLSMMMRSRSYKSSDFTINQRVPILLADGDKVRNEILIYRGVKNFTTEGTNKKTYRCLVFSYMEKVKKKEKEIVTFYITDDKNHIPVRLDMNLRFGTAKAYLTRASGLRNPEESIVNNE